MPCGKRPIRKLWDKPKQLKAITPSKYEQNEASVKVHWKNVLRALELSYKDEQFWETQVDIVRDLVGPTIFQRIAKVFDLPLEATKYSPQAEPMSTPLPSEQLYKAKAQDSELRPEYSLSDFEPTVVEEQEHEDESEMWTTSTIASAVTGEKNTKSRTLMSSRSITVSKSLSKLLSKSFSRFVSRTLSSTSGKLMGSKSDVKISTVGTSANSQDDLDVNTSTHLKYRIHKSLANPHYDMLYCNESETDMIKWKSNYKQKVFEVSASDEFSKRAEILTKKIAKEFYDWWVGLGNLEFTSEIKRPEDIETLFQVWFDEHASRGLMLNPKIIPCVLKSIANYTGVQKASCPDALKRQIGNDIKAQTSPAHKMAFGTSLPQKMKHIPPNNNTEKLWHSVKIPEDLRSMSCVWDDIQHLTSTKAFKGWLTEHPYLPMPPCLETRVSDDKKQLFVVPSDYVLKGKTSSHSVQELALPVSQFSLELKHVLSKLMNE